MKFHLIPNLFTCFCFIICSWTMAGDGHELISVPLDGVNGTITLKKENKLRIMGRVEYDKERIEGVAVKLYKGNELIMDVVTDKSGRYEAELDFGHEYMFHFSKAGYLNKMFAVDAKNNLPKEPLNHPAFPVNVLMIPMEKFEGVDMDVLEFPFALVRFNKRFQLFDNDPKYTQNMSRALAAAMLQSGRAKD